MKEFMPDYNNILKAAKNIQPLRMPLYEHIISDKFMEQILNNPFAELQHGNKQDKREYYKQYGEFFKKMGYDTVSFECCIGPAMPGSGALGRHMPGVIKDRQDFENYPWEEIPEYYIQKFHEHFSILAEVMPQGMKAIGGPGNGVFELVQDVVGYENLCILSYDDPDLYRDLFAKVGTMMRKIWKNFLDAFSDVYAVCRFGDDLGFKSATLLPPEDIRAHIIPQYQKIVSLIHSYNKPFLYHSCGKIFDVMEDLIREVKIDAKHSNEDQIAPFSEWVKHYGDRIGNFGGIDTDHLCRKSEQEIKNIVIDVVAISRDKGGFALGSGNSIPEYVPVSGYLAMVETARVLRGE